MNDQKNDYIINMTKRYLAEGHDAQEILDTATPDLVECIAEVLLEANIPPSDIIRVISPESVYKKMEALLSSGADSSDIIKKISTLSTKSGLKEAKLLIKYSKSEQRDLIKSLLLKPNWATHVTLPNLKYFYNKGFRFDVDLLLKACSTYSFGKCILGYKISKTLVEDLLAIRYPSNRLMELVKNYAPTVDFDVIQTMVEHDLPVDGILNTSINKLDWLKNLSWLKEHGIVIERNKIREWLCPSICDLPRSAVKILVTDYNISPKFILSQARSGLYTSMLDTLFEEGLSLEDYFEVLPSAHNRVENFSIIKKHFPKYNLTPNGYYFINWTRDKEFGDLIKAGVNRLAIIRSLNSEGLEKKLKIILDGASSKEIEAAYQRVIIESHTLTPYEVELFLEINYPIDVAIVIEKTNSYYLVRMLKLLKKYNIYPDEATIRKKISEICLCGVDIDIETAKLLLKYGYSNVEKIAKMFIRSFSDNDSSSLAAQNLALLIAAGISPNHLAALILDHARFEAGREVYTLQLKKLGATLWVN